MPRPSASLSPPPTRGCGRKAALALGALASLGALACDAAALGSGDAAADASADAAEGDAGSTEAGLASGDSSADSRPFGMVTRPTDPLPIAVPPRGVDYADSVYPAGNPPSDAKAALGKALFWDEQLSSDNTVACGTCHRPASGGSDPRSRAARHPGADGTLGTDDDPHGSPGISSCRVTATGIEAVDDPIFGLLPQVTRRKAPSYLDTGFYTLLMRNGSAGGAFADPLDPDNPLIEVGGGLEQQALMPLMNPAEMACDGWGWGHLTDKLANVAPLALAGDLPAALQAALSANPTYPALFEAAFDTPEITPGRIAMAIATHERRLITNQTPWDAWSRGDDAALGAAELAGYTLFAQKARCITCHPPPIFSDSGLHNLGFEATTWDPGYEEVSGQAAHHGLFRTPSLRGVGLREAGGLIHDGRGAGADLAALLDAYNAGEGLSQYSSPRMAPLELTEEEVASLLAFLRDALTDPRARDELPPFDRPTLASEAP